MKNGTRNEGLDCLRVLTMLAIAIGHLYDCMPNIDYEHADPWIMISSRIIRAFVICGVDVFALISGYACFDASFKLSRPVKLWMKAVFYSLAGCIFTGATVGAILHAITPVRNESWWYLTAYFPICFLFPFFNMLVDRMTKKEGFWLIAALLMVFSVYGVMSKFAFGQNDGYSFLWLSVLYFIGAYIHKWQDDYHRLFTPQKSL